jgi:hypothetical protein
MPGLDVSEKIKSLVRDGNLTPNHPASNLVSTPTALLRIPSSVC